MRLLQTGREIDAIKQAQHASPIKHTPLEKEASASAVGRYLSPVKDVYSWRMPAVVLF